MLEFFFIGFLLGISSGISPGPLMAVLIQETIKGNIKNGIVVSIIPIITDIPLILILVFLIKQVEQIEIITKVLSFLGFIVLLYYGIKDLLTTKVDLEIDQKTTDSLKKGFITNIFNPHPYIFWGLIGVPFIVEEDILNMVSFVIGFFTGIVCSKISIALAVEKSKMFIHSKYYIYLVRVSGFVLIIFGLILFSRIF
ncbi:MAG: LysE family transporter [Aquificae bacterium]|nr:LysE family transporter [Aquificota bacterium]